MNDAENNGEASNAGRVESRGSRAWWRLPVLLAAVLAAIVIARSSQNRVQQLSPRMEEVAAPAVDPAGRMVSLSIDFGDGKLLKYDSLPWHEGLTVDELMSGVSRQGNTFTYVVYGSSEMSLVMQIDDKWSEGAGLRNWTYSINDKLADRSFAVYELKPGDRVLWRFGPQE